ncbi:MAG TPA: hypothetical protein GX505_05785 [Clostridiales bacterium]|nr:hypothetical protein [Clostridiales bacterium]
MEFIIIIIIAAVVGNILKAASQAQRKQTYTGRNINMPGRNIPGGQPMPRYDRQPSEWTMHPVNTGSEAITDSRKRESSFVSRRAGFIDDEPVSLELGGYQKIDSSQPAYKGGISKPLQVIETGITQRRHKLDFSRDSLINGIVLSEVLGPPKSRRK